MELPTRSRRGRPQKFGRRAISITLTLPVDALDRLRAIDSDVAHAIVRLLKETPRRRRRPASVELATYGKRSVILVTPVPALRKLPGVQLVPVADGKALIALDRSHGIPQLELDVHELLKHRPLRTSERPVVAALSEILRDARLSHRLSVVERSIIVFESRRAKPSAAA
jgi:hypothetical protein